MSESGAAMEQPELDKGCSASEDAGLTRNRSFKSKQLVRSQAIRESTSPPRTASPYESTDAAASEHVDAVAGDRADTSDSSHSDRCTVISGDRKQPVEIQITSGGWDTDPQSEQRQRTRRWLGQRPHSDSSRDLLSYSPRITCVCGKCACPHCRGSRRKHACPTKQDSGIVCSEDCPDCSDSEQAGPNGDGARKSDSFEAEEQSFYCRCPERKEHPKTVSLGAIDQDEPTGPELVSFLRETLNKNPRDRATLLRIEKELHSLVNDNSRCVVRFPVMTSYGRMLVHRCASLFQLGHHLDLSNKNAVLVSKSGTSGGTIPCTSFREWCTVTFPRSPPRRHDDTLAKSILKRCEGGLGSVPAVSGGRSKSLEQREREYERVRRRIFSTDNCTQDEWPWLAAGPVKLLTPDSGRNKLLKVQSLESRGVPGCGEGAAGAGRGARGAVSKSHSFGGYAGEPPHQRALSKQGDQALSSWRLSPSSSGYKTLSLRSTDSVTPSPSPTGGASPEPGIEATTLVWAVTNMSAVPAGALVIHPQTGRPLMNSDGTVYHFDPNNPPVLYNTAAYAPNGDKIDSNNENRRGKLEKQHSFIDTECECQPSEESRVKCCCECRGHECTQKNTTEKGSPQKIKSASNPTTPIKTRYEAPKPTSPEPPKPKSEITPNRNQPEPKTEPKFNHQPENNHHSPKQPLTPIENQNNYETPNSANQIESPSNPRPSDSTNQRPAYDQRAYDSANQQRAYDSANQQRAYDSANQQRAYDSANQQRSFENRFEIQNHRVKMPEEVFQQNYIQGYRNEDIVSPQSVITYPQGDMAEMQSMMQAKVTPVPVPDHNMRPVSLTSVVYPPALPPPNAYPYINHCRIEQSMQPPPMYQPLMQPEEHKHHTPSPHNDTTFRIDPSYPYAADFSAACGTCEPVAMQQQRGYNSPYGQVEVTQGVMQPYSVPNLLLQQQPMQHYQYQEQQMPVQWQGAVGAVGAVGAPAAPSAPAAPKLMLHELYPVLYPNLYQPYNIVYPQVIPQPFPLVQPMYQTLDKRDHRPAPLPRPPRRAPSRAPPSHTPADHEPDKSEIAMKIQQIKEQMAHMDTKERGKSNNEWRRRNSGSGILGSCPVSFNGRVAGPANDETQLSSAARAIVNSIRNIHNKGTNHYQHDNRRFEPRGERQEFRPRGFRPFEPHHRDAPPRDDRRPLYRPPYLFRQMSPGTWCRRSPGPVPPPFNPPRRPYPDARNARR